MIRKERTGCKELDTTELPSTHKERTEGTLEERGGATLREAMPLEGWGTEFLRQGYLHNPGGC